MEFQKNIDKLVSQILSEEIKMRHEEKFGKKGQWMEVEMDEELHGGQHRIDVANPKGKITAADFKKLRKDRNEEKDMVVIDVLGGKTKDEKKNLRKDRNEQDIVIDDTLIGKTKNLRKDRKEQPDVVVDDILGGKIKYENLRKDRTEQIVIDDVLGRKTKGKLKNLRKDRTEQDIVIDDILDGKVKKRETDEQWQAALARVAVPMAASYIGSKLSEEDEEVEEGNAFTGALSKAKKSGKDSFNVDGKTYHVKENRNNVSLTEDELIDMIENIVKEQMVKDPSEKNNFGVTKPQGLKKTEKAQSESKKENDDYASEVVKKMKDYMKDMFMGGEGYEADPEDFPQSNYQMDKDSKIMKYDPSEAVDEYIEAFAYPGMTNLVYDEIKPDDEMIGKQIKGDSKNGNAVTGKDGKALGNVSKRSEKTGERFKKNFDDNLYGAEQMNVSYKRQSQPVDIAGEKKESGKLNSKKTSTQKAQKIMNQLESVESKTTKIITEDLEKMRNLISYNRKTQ
jgi:hypothetical protein